MIKNQINSSIYLGLPTERLRVELNKFLGCQLTNDPQYPAGYCDGNHSSRYHLEIKARTLQNTHSYLARSGVRCLKLRFCFRRAHCVPRGSSYGSCCFSNHRCDRHCGMLSENKTHASCERPFKRVGASFEKSAWHMRGGGVGSKSAIQSTKSDVTLLRCLFSVSCGRCSMKKRDIRLRLNYIITWRTLLN